MIGMMDAAMPYCHLCQTDDVEVLDVEQGPIGGAGWGTASQEVTRPVTYFRCNLCGRQQSVTG